MKRRIDVSTEIRGHQVEATFHRDDDRLRLISVTIRSEDVLPSKFWPLSTLWDEARRIDALVNPPEDVAPVEPLAPDQEQGGGRPSLGELFYVRTAAEYLTVGSVTKFAALKGVPYATAERWLVKARNDGLLGHGRGGMLTKRARGILAWDAAHSEAGPTRR